MSVEPSVADPIWAIMPILARPDLTVAAIADLLAQSVPTRLLLINQGVDDAFRTQLEAIAEAHSDQVLLWSHQPPLPSLSASWNRALDCVWEAGGTVALVVNNDVRLHRDTIRLLLAAQQAADALFVSAVGVREEQFDPHAVLDPIPPGLGGPDFSCFLITRACHQAWRFDEGFIPAFCEDLDTHRRLLLDGEGHRIFSINLPYLHYASQTIKSLDPERRAALDRQITTHSRTHYAAKWGGPVNGERWTVPWDPTSDQDDVTTPDLQRAVAHG